MNVDNNLTGNEKETGRFEALNQTQLKIIQNILFAPSQSLALNTLLVADR